jgi:hypothetical protein
MPRAAICFAILTISLGCSKEEAKSANSDIGASGGGGVSDGGNSSSGGAQAGNGASAGGSPSAGGSASACAEGVKSASTCEVVGALCSAPSSCCECVTFPGQPSCGSQWSCAAPNHNAESCPEAAPQAGAACKPATTVCQYCSQGRPAFWRCGRKSTGSDEGSWASVAGLTCSG